MERLSKQLVSHVKAAHRGAGRCPECHRMQDWMVRRARLGVVVVGLFTGAIAGPALSLVLVIFKCIRVDNMFAPMGVIALVGFVISAIVFFIRAGDTSPQPNKKHPESKTDTELAQWVEECRQGKTDPFFSWYAAVERNPKGKELPVSLGLLNQATDEFMSELSTGPLLVRIGDNAKTV